MPTYSSAPCSELQYLWCRCASLAPLRCQYSIFFGLSELGWTPWPCISHNLEVKVTDKWGKAWQFWSVTPSFHFLLQLNLWHGQLCGPVKQPRQVRFEAELQQTKLLSVLSFCISFASLHRMLSRVNALCASLFSDSTETSQEPPMLRAEVLPSSPLPNPKAG